MSGVPLFEVNPALDRQALALRFARDRRVQIRDVLTEETAQEVRKVLAGTDWGVAWEAAGDGPHMMRAAEMRQAAPQDKAAIGQKLMKAMQGRDYAFVYGCYPLLTAYQEKWDEGAPHDLIMEYINAEPFLDLVREVTGFSGLVKADAQGTLYQPSHFLSMHDDSHVMEGWRVAYVLNMAIDDWRPEWGGYLQFYDDDGDVIAGYRPRFNALNLFAVPQKHNVTYVPPFAPVGRYAITGWFRDW
ncbi:2OG-Fe(II) oxygenase family protein [Sphingosinicella sp. LHD-64]|uniref:2OG-Fe(II) oxygenase n=1 Tax=Sphingosinicella sp. LHD-64 TaxID=3072139 RepID=UPI00280DB056|nr:2OG-Fe(II) oxygenase family protein [Sphingosinicella sp. LHD-64]MDQ8756396.1 2OG-Fe(II) oxygenase family protein [Sphingosinicella sp. LHD-64]